ncbi:hypothetical protein B0H14DRAFT_78664 [Mycena olivaceomarginata]|nr:hypothetical protein B0H14DRAFT_78664 [Mycena olivaceomarginata]
MGEEYEVLFIRFYFSLARFVLILTYLAVPPPTPILYAVPPPPLPASPPLRPPKPPHHTLRHLRATRPLPPPLHANPKPTAAPPNANPRTGIGGRPAPPQTTSTPPSSRARTAPRAPHPTRTRNPTPTPVQGGGGGSASQPAAAPNAAGAGAYGQGQQMPGQGQLALQRPAIITALGVVFFVVVTYMPVAAQIPRYVCVSTMM